MAYDQTTKIFSASVLKEGETEDLDLNNNKSISSNYNDNNNFNYQENKFVDDNNNSNSHIIEKNNNIILVKDAYKSYPRYYSNSDELTLKVGNHKLNGSAVQKSEDEVPKTQPNVKVSDIVGK